MSAPNLPLRAVGNVRVTQGSTYTAFGRKLNIENGFFTFNGPVANPGINILAMRRNQQVEAGVQVTGTVNSRSRSWCRSRPCRITKSCRGCCSATAPIRATTSVSKAR